MGRAVASVAVCLLVVTAGCSVVSPGAQTEPTPSTETAVPTPTDTQAGTQTPAATAATTSTQTPVPNPWGKETIQVAVDGDTADEVDAEAVVTDAIIYWNGEGQQYTTYPVRFELVEYAADADIIVRYEDTIETCGTTSNELVLGCAPRLSPNVTASDVTTVKIETGYTRATMFNTTKHELGHVVGLEHGDEPMPLMAEHGADIKRPQVPNVSERQYRFNTERVEIYAPAGYRTKADKVVEYLNDSENTPTPDVAYATTLNKSRAEFIIETAANSDCELPEGSGSCPAAYVVDYDGHGETDWYSRVVIELVDLDRDVASWHIASWVTEYVYGEPIEPFTPDATREERERWDR